ncbi:MAG: phosphotransferase [Rhodopila sp.]|nr:phosphotransferase [Rhodopila sp.]
MDSYADIVRFLLSRRLVRPSAIVRGRFSLHDASRRNSNVRVTLTPGRGYFIKTGADQQRRRTLRNEARTYRFLRRALEPAQAQSLLVGLRTYDEDASVLVLDYVDGPTLHDLRRRSGRFQLRRLARLGSDLGRLHRRLLGLGQFHEGCGVVAPFAFELEHPKRAFIDTCSAANHELIRIVQASPGIRAGLQVLTGSWPASLAAAPCLIHGDIRFENVCVETGKATLRIVDWELAARGDPLLDAGAVLAELISLWLMSVPLPTGAEPADCLPFASIPLADVQRAGRAFWKAYAAARRLTEDDRETGLRVAMMHAAARLIQLAFEHLQGESRLTMHAVSHLQLSENLFARPIDGAAHLLGIPE